MPLPPHVTSRNGVYQYLRRIPSDVISAFSTNRIQRSLRTSDLGQARLLAAKIDVDLENKFALARGNLGLGSKTFVNEGWNWPDWECFVLWFKACLIEEDTMLRLKGSQGKHFIEEFRPQMKVWLDDDILREKIKLQTLLLEMSVDDYTDSRRSFVQGYASRIGVTLPVSKAELQRLMAGCLTAELEALGVILEREGTAESNLEFQHPDSVEGPWRQKAKELSPEVSELAVASVTEAEGDDGGGGLLGLVDAWKLERERRKQKVDLHLIKDMFNTVEAFSAVTGTKDYRLVVRRDLLKFRSHLLKNTEYKIPTVNKKVGYIATLLKVAANEGLIDSAIAGGIYMEVPDDEGMREPFTDTELNTIFTHAVFTKGKRYTVKKALINVQFWLPLISACSGLISSEILQLGPDTVVRHLEKSDIWCFRVTTAGSRSIKSLSRERYVPIRQELIDLGLLQLREKAEQEGWRTIWPAVEKFGLTTTISSNYFSSFWSSFQKKELKIDDAAKSLYSLRHNFTDAMRKIGAGDTAQDALMGHTIQGTKKVYGTKREPRPVDIVELNRVVQGLEWDFLKGVELPAE